MSTREELTLQGETCLRLGRVDDAIAHYRDLAHLEPVEWGFVKQLADLLERAGQREGAARQFARWADHLFAEGFHAKAAALYKKVLKLDDADEHALWQLGEVSIALKLRGDARVAFQRVVDLRQRRGDDAGAAIARQRRDALEAVTAVPLMPPTLPPAYASPGPPHPVAREGAPIVDPGAFARDAVTGPTSSMVFEVLASGATAPVVPDSRDRVSDESAFDWANLLGRDVDVAAPDAPRGLATGVSAPPPSPVAVEGAVGESASSAPECTASGDRLALAGASGRRSDAAEVGTHDVEDIDEEVDLTQLLEELKQWDPELPEPLPKPMSAAPAGMSTPAPPPLGPPAVDEVLDAAFADLQRQGDGRAVAEQQLAAGRVFLAAGLASEAARAFERASAEPRVRFEAAMALADLHRSRGQRREAVGWYEQAAAAPVPDAAVKRAVLYDLAESLEALGEPDRAVGVLLDLLSQVEDYRDARAWLDRLLRADAGG